jgi:hypoxanthine-guanine phosphoribosyltransferase
MVPSPQAISAGMLRIPPTNLNKQSQDATVLLIRDVLQRGLQLSEVSMRPVFSNKYQIIHWLGICGCTRKHNYL